MTPSPGEEPLAQALGALAQKERSVAELGEWLRARGVADEDTEAVLEHLIAIGTLDDAHFAARYAEDKRELAGWGSERIRESLLARGVGAEQVEAALNGDDELDRAVSLLIERGVDLGDDRARGRAFGLLARRGYGAELAYEAIRRASVRPDLA
jgi:SOS response regulatory protein OraA/RecX